MDLRRRNGTEAIHSHVDEEGTEVLQQGTDCPLIPVTQWTPGVLPSVLENRVRPSFWTVLGVLDVKRSHNGSHFCIGRTCGRNDIISRRCFACSRRMVRSGAAAARRKTEQLPGRSVL